MPLFFFFEEQALARNTLRSLHPQRDEPPPPSTFEPVPEPLGGVKRYATNSAEYRKAFWEVFHSVPKARAMSVDGVSYEELEFLHYSGPDVREILFDIVAAINQGRVHDSAAALWGDLQLLGIEKRDDKGNVTGTRPRPIGIPAAIRRLANRVLMKHRSSDMCDLFTGRTADSRRLIVDDMREICRRPLAEGGLGMSEEEAEARVKACNVPLQMLTQWVAAAPLKAALALLAVLIAARTGVFIHSIRAYREKTKADRCLAPRTFLSLPAGSAPVRRLELFKINDEVMGGRSTSSVTANGGDVTFSGVINTNGGGFASFRTLGARSAGSDDEAPLGLPAECATVEVAATGDGRRYKATLHVADSWAMSLPVWGADFVTRGGRQTFRLPLRSFVPTRQGRVVKAPPLSPAAVTGVGFSLSLYTADGKPNKEFGDGPFELTVHGVEIKR